MPEPDMVFVVLVHWLDADAGSVELVGVYRDPVTAEEQARQAMRRRGADAFSVHEERVREGAA